MENTNDSVIHWKLFCYETKYTDFDCMIHQHKKNPNTPVVFIFTLEVVFVGEKILRSLEMKM